MGETIEMTCPICGMLVRIDKFKKNHKFPRVVIRHYKGRCRIEIEELDEDDPITLECIDIVLSQIRRFLNSIGYEVVDKYD